MNAVRILAILVACLGLASLAGCGGDGTNGNGGAQNNAPEGADREQLPPPTGAGEGMEIGGGGEDDRGE